MVVVVADDGMQIDNPPNVFVDLRAVLGMSFGELMQAAGFVCLIVHKDRAGAVRRDRLKHEFDARDRGIVAAQIKKFDVLKDSGGAFNVAGPLKGNLLVGTHADPARNG